MPGSYKQVNVKCPYYRSDNGRDRIICEGLLPGTSLQSWYERREHYRAHMRAYCTGKYWDCPICAALDEKYRED